MATLTNILLLESDNIKVYDTENDFVVVCHKNADGTLTLYESKDYGREYDELIEVIFEEESDHNLKLYDPELILKYQERAT